MLDSGGKSRVKGTLQPLSGSAHPAIIPARILAPWLWGKTGHFVDTFFNNEGPKVPGARNLIATLLILNTDNLYISGYKVND
jgi:hypothetical protein